MTMPSAKTIMVPLFAVLVSLCLPTQAQPNQTLVNCAAIFQPMLQQEPYLKQELSDLQKTCELESQTLTRYWSCVEKRQAQGEASFDRLVVSAKVCNDLSVAYR